MRPRNTGWRRWARIVLWVEAIALLMLGAVGFASCPPFADCFIAVLPQFSIAAVALGLATAAMARAFWRGSTTARALALVFGGLQLVAAGLFAVAAHAPQPEIDPMSDDFRPVPLPVILIMPVALGAGGVVLVVGSLIPARPAVEWPGKSDGPTEEQR